MAKGWEVAELKPPQLLRAPLRGTEVSLELQLQHARFAADWLGRIGRYGNSSSNYKFDPRKPYFDDLVRCAGRAEDLHEALRECAPFAGRVRKLLCLAASRGEALELGLVTWARLQTDEMMADSLAMMLGAYLACFNHIDLLHDDVSALPYFVQILAEFVRFGLFQQDKETFELRYGEKLERFTAMAGRGNPTAADLLGFFQGLAFSMAVPAAGCNNAKCGFGVTAVKSVLTKIAWPWVRVKYGTATPAEALDALRAFPEYRIPYHIMDINWAWFMRVREILARVVHGTLDGLKVELIKPDDGKALEDEFIFSAEYYVNDEGNVSPGGTIFCSIGVRFLALDGEILAHEGAVPAVNVAVARDARHNYVVEVMRDAAYAAKLRAADAALDAEMCAPLPQTKEEAIAMGDGYIALVARCSARGLKQCGTVAQLRARLEDPQPEDYPHCAPRAPHGPQAVARTVDLQRAEAAPLAEAAGASRGVSTLVPTPTSLESIATRPTPERDAVINFAPPKRIKGPKHCLMCGKQGVEPLQAHETAADCVIIPKDYKGVCKVCAKVWWVSNGCYFKWCQGRKNFREIHEFEGRLTASKCNAAAKEIREKRRKRDAAKAPGPAKKARKA
jgi:uncharacterized protein (DUF1330 family)